ncbi:MAG: PEP-CTERM sorting domain-containing protein [Myxococcota bacterium]
MLLLMGLLAADADAVTITNVTLQASVPGHHVDAYDGSLRSAVVEDPDEEIPSKASVEVTDSANKIAIKQRATPQGPYDDDGINEATTYTQVEFTVDTTTNYLLAISGTVPRPNASIHDRGQFGGSLSPTAAGSGFLHFLSDMSEFYAPSPVSSAQQFTGQLAPGDYSVDLYTFSSAHTWPDVEIDPDTGDEILLGYTATSSFARADLVIGFGSEAESLVDGGAAVFDASTPGTMTSQSFQTGDLSSVLSTEAFDAVDFVASGATAQAWEVDYTGTLDGNAVLQFAYDDTLLDVPEAALAVAHFTEAGVWEILQGAVDPVANLITVETSSFSPFVLAVPEPGTGLLVVSALIGLAAARRRRFGRSAASAIVCVLGLASAFPGAASAVPIVDQFNFSSQIDFGAIGGADVRGQTFTVGVEGTIAQVRIELTGENSTLSMGIYATSGGVPTGAPLAVALNPSDLGSVLKEFDFSSAGLSVTPGEELAFAVSDPTNLGSYRNAFGTYSAGTIVASTDGGSTWSTVSNRDSNFSVLVEPIPEPSTGLLMGLGLAGLAFARRGREPR